MNRRTLIAVGMALPFVVGALTGLVAVQPAHTAGTSMLPDLSMAPISNVSINNTGSQLQLRFSATIVNVGLGPMEVSATRHDAASPFLVSQRVYEGGDTYTDSLVSGAALVWGGDGHNHWHVRDLETYELDRLPNERLATGMKGGFCFYDTTSFRLSLPGAPLAPVYVPATSCGAGNQSALGVRMGISVGWGDTYGAGLRDQYIDVTNVPSGTYRLFATADGAGQFHELNEDNNTTWADVKLTLSRKGKGKGGNSATIVGYGPTP